MASNEPLKIDPTKLYKIIIDEQGGVDGNTDVFVGVNGKQYQIVRNQEVVVEGFVVNALEEAIYTKYKYDGKGNTVSYKVKRFPVRVLGEATKGDKVVNKRKINTET